jgi:pimeloyl-ACP methyl ester carboxylesterase
MELVGSAGYAGNGEGTAMTIVLVHGAWHHPWHWHQLVPRLPQPVVIVDLPSCGPEHADMHADAAAIRRVLDDQAEVTLVAHSYGGIPATEAAAGHTAVSGLVYLAAYNADRGEKLSGFIPADPTEPNIRPEVDRELTPDGLLEFRPDRAAEVLYHDCPDPTEAIRHLRPMAPAFAEQEPHSVAWRDIRSAYVVCTRDRATAVSVQRRLATRADRIVEIDSGHSAFLSHPQRLAEIITEAAQW